VTDRMVQPGTNTALPSRPSIGEKSRGNGHGRPRAPGAARQGQPLPPRAYEALFETAPDAMIVVDEAGTMLLANAQTETFFGYLRVEMIGQPVEMLLRDRQRLLHFAHRENYLASPSTRPMASAQQYAGHLAGRRKDGTEIFLAISLSPLETPRGRLVSAAIRNVSDVRESQHENQAAILNILDDFTQDKKRLESSQAAILNILDDFNSEM
jgi:PAS domain S-box-containing protein